ncbi:MULTISPECIES: hypothetical protein [unclassified Knoellia]|uniref:hypothetical protein n=1 Tax=Knoellia altitudinis TaxID=3404795 RepID=UPI00360A7C1B
MKSVDDAHTRPEGTSDATVEAVGKLSEAFEVIEEARGSLYAFHRNLGRADLTLGEAVEKLRAAGHTEFADEIETDLVGRNVLAGRWTFQIMEEFDDGYYATFREHDRRVRDELMAGRRHVYEAEMKQERRTHGRQGHEATPTTPTSADD